MKTAAKIGALRELMDSVLNEYHLKDMSNKLSGMHGGPSPVSDVLPSDEEDMEETAQGLPSDEDMEDQGKPKKKKISLTSMTLSGLDKNRNLGKPKAPAFARKM